MNCDIDDQQVGAGAGVSGPATPALVLESPDACLAVPRTPARLQLDSVRAVRREMARVYAAAARGQVSTRRAAQMVFMLNIIGKTVESEKVDMIEKAMRKLANSGKD